MNAVCKTGKQNPTGALLDVAKTADRKLARETEGGKTTSNTTPKNRR